MSDYGMADIASLLGTNTTVATNSTSRKNNTDLDMTDFLKLMIVQLQSQTMDDTMDTSEMMNQLVQMQMVTAITNMTETNIMSYAGSMVGKVVTVGIADGNTLEERVITVMGTGTYDGNQVIFGSDGQMYQLKQIMAVGLLPNEDGTYGPQQPGEGGGSEGGGEVTDPGDKDDGGITDPGDKDESGEISGGDETGSGTGDGEEKDPEPVG